MGKHKKRDKTPVELRIKLPLEMDVASTLLKVIGLTYPRTQIGRDDHKWDYERELVLLIDQRDRHKSPKAKRKYEKIRDYADGWSPGALTELGPDGVAASPHELLALSWVDMARKSFAMFPDAANYIENTVYDEETGQRYVFYVAKSKEQTPHELRQKAEARVAELEAELAELKAKQDPSA